MEPDSTDNKIKDGVLEKIRLGRVKMHGHAYFVGRTALLVLGLVVLLFLGIFAVSFLIFLLNSNKLLLLPAFGTTGLVRLLLLFPWLIMILTLLFMVLLEVFVRRFAFAYHQPAMYTALGIFVLMSVAGLALAKTPLHEALADLSGRTPIPFVSQLYHNYAAGHVRGLYVGRILRVEGNKIELVEPGVSSLPIWLTDQTILPAGSYFHPDDKVMILCPDECRENMEVVGIKKLNDNDYVYFRRFHAPGSNGAQP